MRRSGAVRYYATLLRRTYAKQAKDAAGRSAAKDPSVTQPASSESAGNHAYTPLTKGSVEPSANTSSSNTGAPQTGSTSTKAANHAYTPSTTGSTASANTPKVFSTAAASRRGISSSSSSDEDHALSKAANRVSGKLPSKQPRKGGSSSVGPAQAEPSSAPGNHAYPPTAGPSEPSPSAPPPGGSKPSPQQQAAPGNHAYKPTGNVTSAEGSSASVKAGSSASPVQTQRSVEASGANHAYKPTGSVTSAKDSAARSQAEPVKASAASAAASSATKPVQGSPRQSSSSGAEAKGPQQGTSGPAGQGYPPSTSGSVTEAAASPKAGGPSSRPGSAPPASASQGNHAYPPTAGMSGPSSSSSGSSSRRPPYLVGSPPSDGAPAEPLPGGRNRWRLHPYMPVDVRLLTAALLGLGAYFFHQSPGDQTPPGDQGPTDDEAKSQNATLGTGKQDDNYWGTAGEPQPFDTAAAAQHEERLRLREQERGAKSQNAVLGTGKQDDNFKGTSGEPEPFDTASAAKAHAEKRLREHSSQSEPKSQNAVLGTGKHNDDFKGTSGEPEPFDTAASYRSEQRLQERSSQHEPKSQNSVLGTGQQDDDFEGTSGEPEPFDTEAAAKFEQRLNERRRRRQSGVAALGKGSQEDDFHSSHSGQPEPLDTDVVAKHEQSLQGDRHQNFYSDELALSDESAPDSHTHLADGPKSKEIGAQPAKSKQGKTGSAEEKTERGADGSDDKSSKGDEAVYVDPAPLAALFQEALGGSPSPAPAQREQLEASGTAQELQAGPAEPKSQNAVLGTDKQDDNFKGTSGEPEPFDAASAAKAHAEKRLRERSSQSEPKSQNAILGTDKQDDYFKGMSGEPEPFDAASAAKAHAEKRLKERSSQSEPKSQNAVLGTDKQDDNFKGMSGEPEPFDAASAAKAHAEKRLKERSSQSEPKSQNAILGTDKQDDNFKGTSGEAEPFDAASAAKVHAEKRLKERSSQPEVKAKSSQSTAETAQNSKPSDPKSRPPTAGGSSPAAKGKKKSDKSLEEKAEGRVEQGMHVIKAAMEDTAGATYFHDDKAEKQDTAAKQLQGAPETEQKQQQQQPPPQYSQQAPELHGLAGELPKRPILGISENLSGGALVRKAIEAGRGAQNDWAEFKHRHQQAAVDSDLLYSVLQQAEQYHEAEVDRLGKLIEGHARRADYILEAAEQNIDAFEQTLEQQERRHEHRRQTALQHQRQTLARAAAQEMVAERKQRMSSLRQIRAKLQLLEQSFSYKGNEQDISHTAHRLSVGTFALQSALDKGKPFESELQFLSDACQGDPLVQTAVLSFPQSNSLKGIPTRSQLVDRWAGVSKVTRQLSSIPQGQGGALSMAVASFASALKLREEPRQGGPDGAPVQGAGLESRLAHAEACLISGQLLAAATQLQKAVQGTEAAPLVQDWVHAAKARAIAEQTSDLLQAHAATMAASLSH